MAQYRICLPSKRLAHAFQELAQPLIDSVGVNIHESRTLVQTRDVVLPKFMSGEIRVAEAEEAMEEAA